jgi:hypothetical protein
MIEVIPQLAQGTRNLGTRLIVGGDSGEPHVYDERVVGVLLVELVDPLASGAGELRVPIVRSRPSPVALGTIIVLAVVVSLGRTEELIENEIAYLLAKGIASVSDIGFAHIGLGVPSPKRATGDLV